MTSTASGFAMYEFRKGSTVVQGRSNNNIYQIASVSIGSDDGSYTCIVMVDGKESSPSLPDIVQGMCFIYCILSFENAW